MSDPQTPDHDDLRTVDYDAYQGVDSRACTGCGGNLRFDPASQSLQCTSCGNTATIDHAPDERVEQRPFTPTSNTLSSRTASMTDIFSFARQITGSGLNPSAGGATMPRHSLMRPNTLAGGPPATEPDLGNQKPTRLTGEKEIICQSCGGRTTFLGSLTSDRCPYCATPLQLNDVHDAPDRLAVDGVLPFGVDESEAKVALDAWVNGRWFAPTEFKKYSKAGSFASLYAAYFTYDADAITDYEGKRGRRQSRGSGDNRTTYTDWTFVSGQVHDRFVDLAIPANTGLHETFVAQLEPWPMEKLKPYNADYLAGHLARTYDHDSDVCFGKAQLEMSKRINKTIERDIGGDEQKILSRQTELMNTTFRHVLLPIWLLTVVYGGKTWQVFMNGDTGEVHGERPYSKAKIIAAVATVLTIIVAVLIAKAALSS